jgi:hypothetical protein
LTATKQGESQINLAWTDNASDESGFAIERKLTETFAQVATVGANVASYQDTGLNDDTTYTYRVRAYNAGGNSSYSNEDSATTDAGAGGGTEEEIIRPNANGDTMDWDAEAGDYTRVDEVTSDGDTTRLYTPTDNKVALFNFQNTTHSTINSVTVKAVIRGLDPIAQVTQVGVKMGGTEYWINKNWNSMSYITLENTWNTNPNTSAAWTQSNVNDLQAGVKRISGGGTAITQVYVELDVGTVTPPTAPALSLVVNSHTSITPSWTDTSVLGDDTFTLERKTGTGSWAEVTTIDALTFIDTGLEAGTAYIYRVKVNSTAGESPYSTEQTDTTDAAPSTIPDAPTSLVATVDINTVGLVWIDNADNEDEYTVNRKVLNGSYEELASLGVDSEEYYDTSVTAGIYKYKVSAKNSTGEAFSNEAEVTIEESQQQDKMEIKAWNGFVWLPVGGVGVEDTPVENDFARFTGADVIEGRSYSEVRTDLNIADGATANPDALDNISEDVTPQLGGNLDINGKQIVTVSNGHILLMPNGTGKVGIGTTTPEANLQITNATSDNALFIDQNADTGRGDSTSGAILLDMTGASDSFGLNVYSKALDANDLVRININAAYYTKVNGGQTINDTSTSLTIDSTSGFPASGTLIVHNNTSKGENNDTCYIHYTGIDATHFTGVAGAFYKPSVAIVLVDNAIVDYCDTVNTGTAHRIMGSGSNGGAVDFKITAPNPDIELIARGGYNNSIGEGQYEIDVPKGDNITENSTDCIRINGRNDANNSFETIALFTRPGLANQGMVGIGFQNKSTPTTVSAHLHIKNDDFKGDTNAASLVGQIIQGAENQTADLFRFVDDGGNTLSVFDNDGKLGIGSTDPATNIHISGATTSELRLETSGAGDPALSFKTTNTANHIKMFLNESETNEHFIVKGQTAAIDTYFDVRAQDGKNAYLTVGAGSDYGSMLYSSGDIMRIRNHKQDADIRFYINNGGAGEDLLSLDASESRVGISTSSPTAKLDIDSDVVRLRTAKTPATAGAAGTQGSICWDASYIYVCTATNTWRRIAHSSW